MRYRCTSDDGHLTTYCNGRRTNVVASSKAPVYIASASDGIAAPLSTEPLYRATHAHEMSCILHVDMPEGGKALVETLSIKPYKRVERGTPIRQRPGMVYDSDLLSFDVSDADFQDLPQQFEDAVAFLTMNEADVEALARGGEAVLDFGHSPRSWAEPMAGIVQVDRIPQELLRLCARLDVQIELSMYLWQDEEESAPNADAV